MKKFIKISSIVLISLFFLYTLIGFFALPFLAKKYIQEDFSESIDHKIAIDKIKFNPFTFKLLCNDLEITTPNSDRVIGVGQLLGDFDFSSLWKDQWILTDVIIDNPFIALIIEADQSINLTRLTPPASENKKLKNKTDDNKESKTILIKNLQIISGILNFEDRSQNQPVQIAIKPIDLKVSDLSTRHFDEHQANLEFTVNETGKIILSGASSIEPITTSIDLEIIDLNLAAFQAYIPNQNIVLKNGSISTKQNISYSSETTDILINGNMIINDVEISEKEKDGHLLGLESVDIHDLSYKHLEKTVVIDSIKLNDALLNLLIEKDKRMNLNKIFAEKPEEKPENNTAENTDLSSLSSVQNSENASTQSDMSIRISEVILQNGAVSFTDKSVSPVFEEKLSPIELTAKPIEWPANQPIDYTLTFLTKNQTPFESNGTLQLGEKTNANIKVSLKDYALNSTSPYTSQAIGYDVENGTFGFEIHYDIQDNKLKAKHDILLSQVDLKGSKNSSGIKLPIELAFLLLEDMQRNIKINLPVSGDISDPKFKYGHILIQGFFGLITKVATAPLSILGKTAGGLAGLAGLNLGEANTEAGSPHDNSLIKFISGTPGISSTEKKKLEAFAQLLRRKPQLKLQITPSLNSEDQANLKTQILNEKILSVGKPGSRSERKWLETEIKNLFGKSDLNQIKNDSQGNTDLYVSKMKEKILTKTEVSESQITDLIQQRTQTIQNELLKFGLLENQIEILETDKTAETSGAQINIGL